MMSWFDHELIIEDFDTVGQPEPDVKEKDGTYVVKTDMPGLKKNEIHIELKNGTLTLRGERHEKPTGEHTQNRRIFGSIERKFRVPEGVYKKDIRTKYADGVLELTIPAPKAKKSKIIEVKAA